jgi:hypothetical protein
LNGDFLIEPNTSFVLIFFVSSSNTYLYNFISFFKISIIDYFFEPTFVGAFVGFTYFTPLVGAGVYVNTGLVIPNDFNFSETFLYDFKFSLYEFVTKIKKFFLLFIRSIEFLGLFI